MAVGYSGANQGKGEVKVYSWVEGPDFWRQEGPTLSGYLDGDCFGFSLSLSASGDTLAVGAPCNGFRGGYVDVYENNGGQWTLLGATMNGSQLGERFGASVRLAGDTRTVVVGATESDRGGLGAGTVRVFSFVASSWVQRGQGLDGSRDNEYFGHSVGISNDGRKVVGGGFGDGLATAILRLYVLSNASPPPTQAPTALPTPSPTSLTPIDPASATWVLRAPALDGEGRHNTDDGEVAISGDGRVVAISSPEVQVYRYDEFGRWVQMGESITDSSSDILTVALNDDGTILAIGDVGRYSWDPEAVRTYVFTGIRWAKTGTIGPPEGVGDNWGGYYLALSRDGNVFATRGRSGPVAVYDYDATIFGWKRREDDSLVGNGPNSGIALSRSGQTVAVGFRDANVDTGEAKVFRWQTPGFWQQVGETLTGKERYNGFGASVSLSGNGDIVAIGAPQSNTSTGFVEVYELQGGVWSKLGGTLEGNHTSEQFGVALKLSEDGQTLAIGAPGTPEVTEEGIVRVYRFDGTSWSRLGGDLVGTVSREEFGLSVGMSNNGRTVVGGSFGGGISNAIARAYDLV